MSFLIKHWRITVAAVVAVCVITISVYALYPTKQPLVAERHYVMPEGYTEIPPGTDQVQVIHPAPEMPTTGEASYATIDAPDEATREELIAKRDALITKRDELLSIRAAQIAKKEALIAENKALRAELAQRRFLRTNHKGDLIGELLDWATTEYTQRAQRISPDLERNDELGLFAEIEAIELWDETVNRVAQLDADTQQQIIDEMRNQGHPEAADLMAHGIAQLSGGVK